MPASRALADFSLAGKTAVVTGCNRGIGLALAETLSSAGAEIVGVSRSRDTPVDVVRAAVEGNGRSFTSYEADFRSGSEVTALAAAILRDLEIDILINNAGTIRRAPAIEQTDEDWDEVVQVNLSSQFVLTRALARQMIERGGGKIVFIASILSFQGGINVPAYVSAKSAIAGLTRALANEWAVHGVNVNAIAPGYFATDNTKNLRADPVRHAAILGRIPMGRWGEPSDLGGAAVFLSSRASDYVHGVTLPVDGGWLSR